MQAKTSGIGIAFGLFGVVAILAGAASAQGHDMRRAWNEPVAPLQIVNDVYYVGAAGVSAFLVKTTAGAIVLDGGFEETAPQILANLRTLGVAPRDVKWLLVSHAHFDHAGGLAALKRATKSKVVAGAADAADLEAGRSVDLGTGTDDPFPAVKVDRRVNDGDTVVLGKTKLTAHATPGHTRGCTSWTMTTTDAGKPVDVIFHCSTTAPGYTLVGNKKYPTIADDYRKTFAVIEKLHADVFLGPHPMFFDLDEKRARKQVGAPNPFVDATALQRFNATSRAEWEAAFAKQSSAQPKGN